MANRLFIRPWAKIGIALCVLSAALAAAAIAATAYARAYGSVMPGLAALGAMALMPVAYRFAR